VPASVNQVSVSVLSKKSAVFDQSASQGTEVGHHIIQLASLASHVEEDSWFPLSSLNTEEREERRRRKKR